jgi:hypothetical protein
MRRARDSSVRSRLPEDTVYSSRARYDASNRARTAALCSTVGTAFFTRAASRPTKWTRSPSQSHSAVSHPGSSTMNRGGWPMNRD